MNVGVTIVLKAMTTTVDSDEVKAPEKTISSPSPSSIAPTSTPTKAESTSVGLVVPTPTHSTPEPITSNNTNTPKPVGSVPVQSPSYSYNPDISQDKAKFVEEEITTKEKAKVVSILIGKLSPSEVALFLKMAGDGLTVDEKKEAKKLILKKLTENEYNELISIAAKYGLSQGKDYQESLNE